MAYVQQDISRPVPLDPEERMARIALALSPGIGATKYFRLIEHFKSARSVLTASLEELHSLIGPSAAQLESPAPLMDKAHQCVEDTEQVGGRVVVWEDPDYPNRLKRMARPPMLLYVAGSLALPEHTVGIVGRRAAVRQGLERASSTAALLSREGVAVISGGAYGIDAAAHRGALDSDGTTICVLGGSLDHPYPERHFRLFAQIADTGALLSIFAPDTEPRRNNFLQRNKIIAALSDLLVVVEAGARSGSRSTALAAAGMGVPVAAFPGSIGTNRLIAEGALQVGSDRDVVTALQRGPSDRHGGPTCDPMANISLTADSRRLLDVLARGPGRTVGFLAWQTGLTMGRLAAALVELRLAGLAEQTPGGRWTLIAAHRDLGQERDNGEKRRHDETGSGGISSQGSNDREVPGS